MICPCCDRPTADGLMCHTCTGRLTGDLRTMARLWPALEGVLAKTARRGSGGGRRTDPSPLPLDPHAYKVRTYVRNQVTTWCRELDLGDPPPDGRTRTLILWLIARIQRIRGHGASDEIAAEMGYCRTLVWQAVDLAAERTYCGACDTCGADLYARPGATEVLCRDCEKAGLITLPVDVAARREAMRATAEDTLVTMDELLTAVPSLYGVEIRRGTVVSWASRGRLASHAGRYRVGDVLTLAARQLEGPDNRRVGT